MHTFALIVPWIVLYAGACWWAIAEELCYMTFQERPTMRRRIALAITSPVVLVVNLTLDKRRLHTLYLFCAVWYYNVLRGQWLPKHLED